MSHHIIMEYIVVACLLSLAKVKLITVPYYTHYRAHLDQHRGEYARQVTSMIVGIHILKAKGSTLLLLTTLPNTFITKCHLPRRAGQNV